MKKDAQLTELAGFADRRSYVAPDGREVLYGIDWLGRKLQLLERCGGRCEQIVSSEGKFGPELRCRADAADPHHIIKRSVQRDDRLANLLALCRLHHNFLDRRQPQWTKKSA